MNSVYGQCVEHITKKRIKSALQEEQNATENVPTNSKTIDIMSDARHACRKNSYHCDVTALGQRTHKVVNYQHVTKQDDVCSQRHEMVDTRKLYDIFDRDQVTVRVHSHDRNASVSKFLRTDRPGTNDSYDTLHAAKEVRKVITEVTKGTKRQIGISWHPELADKTAGVKTHLYWAMKSSNGIYMKTVILVLVAWSNIMRHQDTSLAMIKL